jgi:hypothetical protein
MSFMVTEFFHTKTQNYYFGFFFRLRYMFYLPFNMGRYWLDRVHKLLYIPNTLDIKFNRHKTLNLWFMFD